MRRRGYAEISNSAEREVEATVITGGYGDRTEALRDGGWDVVEGTDVSYRPEPANVERPC